MIEITYELLTANGNPIQRTIFVQTLGEAEYECQNIERVGYKLIDVTTVD